MSVCAKFCTNCSYENNSRSKVCVKCGVSLCKERGRSRGRPRSILFHDSIQLPEHWDKSETSLNVDDLLSVCSRRIAQQRTYDKKPLGVAVTGVGTCYGVVLMVPTVVTIPWDGTGRDTRGMSRPVPPTNRRDPGLVYRAAYR